jgi:benzoate/toluate 1,2-dioxygenase subunit beta
MARTAKKSAPRRKRASAATGAPIKRIVKPNGVRDTLREVEQFLFRQADLLDERRWRDFIELFADDGLYWMPASPEQTTGEGVPSIFYEDRNLMTVRMKRVTHPHAWSQSAMWGTSHLVSNVAIEKDDPRTGEITVRSRFHMMEFRRDVSRHFAGTYRHRLAKTKDGYRIKLQRVDMVNGQGPYDYVLQVWV